jgi:hypothetical protein
LLWRECGAYVAQLPKPRSSRQVAGGQQSEHNRGMKEKHTEQAAGRRMALPQQTAAKNEADGAAGSRMLILQGTRPARHDAAHARAKALPAAAQPCGVGSAAGCTVGFLRGQGRRRDWGALSERAGGTGDFPQRPGKKWHTSGSCCGSAKNWKS